MKKRKIIVHISTLLIWTILLLPVVAGAQTVGFVIGRIDYWVGQLIPVAFSLGLLFFLYGIAKYILSGGDEGKRAEAKQMMFWGVIALFVMVSVWGLVRFIQDSFGINRTNIGIVPDISY